MSNRVLVFLPVFLSMLEALNGSVCAADATGSYKALGPISCLDFLQLHKDEAVAKAKEPSPERGGIYTFGYLMLVRYIEGAVTGFNIGRDGVYNVFPGHDSPATVEFVKRECDRKPAISLSQAIDNAIFNNQKNWQRTK